MKAIHAAAAPRPPPPPPLPPLLLLRCMLSAHGRASHGLSACAPASVPPTSPRRSWSESPGQVMYVAVGLVLLVENARWREAPRASTLVCCGARRRSWNHCQSKVNLSVENQLKHSVTGCQAEASDGRAGREGGGKKRRQGKSLNKTKTNM